MRVWLKGTKTQQAPTTLWLQLSAAALAMELHTYGTSAIGVH